MSDYLSEFNLSRIARVGVIATRTREARRTQNLLQAFAANGEQKPQPFYRWDAAKGWEVLKYGKPDAHGVLISVWEKYTDYEPDNGFIAALLAVEKFADNAIAVMTHPHPHFDSPTAQAIISEYCHIFPSTGHTLVFVIPEACKIPVEIEPEITIIDLELPDVAAMAQIALDKIGQSRDLPSSEIVALSHSGAGMTQFEAEKAFSRAAAKNIDAITSTDIGILVSDVLQSKEEIIRKSETLELYPPVNMDTVGGLHGLKQWLDFNKIRLESAAIAKGADPMKGVLVVGPPGNGKSLIAKAIAAKLSLPLIRFDVGMCFGGIVGESEAKTTATFKTLKALGQCIIWIDEIDKAGLSSGANGDSGASSRVLQQLLFNMQEMNEGAFFVLTANDVTQIPIELLRPGRLDEKFFVDIPNVQDRWDILKIHLKKRGYTAPSVPMNAFDLATTGFIGAEIEKCVVDTITFCLNNGKLPTSDLLLQHAKAINPISNSHKERFEAMRKWGDMHAVNASTLKEDKNEIVAAKPRPLPPSRPLARPTITKR